MSAFKSVDEQLAYIKKGVAEIIPEPELVAKLEASRKTGKPLRVYLGVDPTAPDLHLGHTVVLRKLKHFQDLGHTAVFLIGDFSAMIGDPTGVSETRPPLSREEVDANAKTYLAQVFTILDAQKTEVRYNSEWLDKLSSYDIVRLCGHYQLSRLLEREDFRKRLESGQAWELRRQRREALKSYAEALEVKNPPAIPDLEARKTLTPIEPAKTTDLAQPISVHELLYPLLTAYDAVMLRSDVELGATEQKFNLLVHREIQREYGLPGQAILTMPILVGSDGQRKMSKSFRNYIGITEPPNEMFGKIMKISDDLMWSYWELVTDKTEAEIQTMRRSLLEPPPPTLPPVTTPAGRRSPLHAPRATNPMDIKRELAGEVVATFHGKKAADSAAEHFRRVVRERLVPEEMPQFRIVRATETTFFLSEKRGNVEEVKPPFAVPGGKEEKWSKILLLLGQVSSAAEAERLMKPGGLEINGRKIQDPSARLDLTRPGSYTLRLGKKGKFVRVVVE